MDCTEDLTDGRTCSLHLEKSEPVTPATPSPPPPLLLSPVALASCGPSSIPQRAIELRTMLKEEASGRFHIIPDYMESVQTGMSTSWRRKLVAWMQDVSSEFGFSMATTSSAVQIFDRFLSKFRVEKPELQLLALVSCFSSSKLNESAGAAPLLVADLAARVGNIYSVEDIRRAELVVSTALGWDLNSVTAFDFMSHLTCLLQDPKTAADAHAEATKILEAALMDANILRHRPTSVGVAALICAFKVIGHDPKPFIDWIVKDHGINIASDIDGDLVLSLFTAYYRHPDARAVTPDHPSGLPMGSSPLPCVSPPPLTPMSPSEDGGTGAAAGIPPPADSPCGPRSCCQSDPPVILPAPQALS